MSNSKDFSNRVVIVTGSSSGIGAATVAKFAKCGAKVVVTGRDASRVKRVADECRCVSPQSLEALQVVGDLTNEEDCVRLINATIDKFGKLDVLVTNAGLFSSIQFDDPKLLETYDAIIATNVRPVLRLIQLASPHLEKSKGNIVVTSSQLSFRPIPVHILYGMSKASLDLMVKSLALELGPKGVRINSINPAIVDNNFISRSLNLDPEQMHEAMARAGATYPLRRLGTVDDISNAITFLASNDSAWITGQNLVLDGGSTWGGSSETQ